MPSGARPSISALTNSVAAVAGATPVIVSSAAVIGGVVVNGDDDDAASGGEVAGKAADDRDVRGPETAMVRTETSPDVPVRVHPAVRANRMNAAGAIRDMSGYSHRTGRYRFSEFVIALGVVRVRMSTGGR